jgi:hypothetical protein
VEISQPLNWESGETRSSSQGEGRLEMEGHVRRCGNGWGNWIKGSHYTLSKYKKGLLSRNVNNSSHSFPTRYADIMEHRHSVPTEIRIPSPTLIQLKGKVSSPTVFR